ncbi:hypothetical protein GDO86_003285 [Hymenochirus boettgeri]|uniref:Uncharacterized protein n=1 Tax=Hymenochirus boettgeri TaxID=247094 RepID=A0A8T2K4E2_9PIPI|nr:hypothetical protein GDO86_003285 [Hymenochirus boettgeri]
MYLFRLGPAPKSLQSKHIYLHKQSSVCFYDCGGNRSAWRKPVQTWGEQTKSLQMCPRVDVNSEYQRCKASVLTTKPPFCPIIYLQIHLVAHFKYSQMIIYTTRSTTSQMLGDTF